MIRKNLKQALVKELEADFAKKFRVVLAPMKAEIRQELRRGRSAHQAVDHVFRERDVRGKLKEIIPDLMIKAVRHGE